MSFATGDLAYGAAALSLRTVLYAEWPLDSDIRRSERKRPALGWADKGFRPGCPGRGLRDLWCRDSWAAACVPVLGDGVIWVRGRPRMLLPRKDYKDYTVAVMVRPWGR